MRIAASRSSTHAAICLALVLLACAACARPNRISRGDLRRLTRSADPIVLVFGSLSTPPGMLARPELHFSHQATRSAPAYLLKSMTISTGDRFYAILQPPPSAAYSLPYPDEFYIEVGRAVSNP